MFTRGCYLAFCLCLASALGLMAGETRTSAKAAPAAPCLVAAFSAAPVTVDGKLDEPAWQQAASTGPFAGPTNADADCLAARPEYRTEAKVLWDADNLYFGFVCRSPSPPWATFQKHDEPLYNQDVCEVFLAMLGDCRQYAEFQSSPRGVTLDAYHVYLRYPADESHHLLDMGWNQKGFKSAGAPLVEDGKEAGWTVEMKIPVADLLAYRDLPAQLRAGQIVYLNLLRYAYPVDPANPAKHVHRHLNWSPVPNGCPHMNPHAMLPVQCAPPAQDGPGAKPRLGNR